VRALHLEVARDNEAAKALYRRFGFADRAHHLMTRIAHGENVNE
jgi:ribosomal protein S18 acetylase RimI-like enzyme